MVSMQVVIKCWKFYILNISLFSSPFWAKPLPTSKPVLLSLVITATIPRPWPQLSTPSQPPSIQLPQLERNQPKEAK